MKLTQDEIYSMFKSKHILREHIADAIAEHQCNATRWLENIALGDNLRNFTVDKYFFPFFLLKNGLNVLNN